MTEFRDPARATALRNAVRWLSDLGKHDARAIEEACRLFDLSPADEDFLLRQFLISDDGDSAPRD